MRWDGFRRRDGQLLMAEAYVRVDEAELWVEQSGSGCPVLLSHGGPGLCDNLGGLAAMLGNRFLTIRYDQRGCHRSGRGLAPLTVRTLLDDMEEIRQSRGIRRWIVGGHSWGANLSLLYTLLHPERTLALLYISGGGIDDADRTEADLEARRARLTDEEYCWLREAMANPRDPAAAGYGQWNRKVARLFWLSDFSDRAAAPDLDVEPLFPVSRDAEIFDAISSDFKTYLGPGLADRMRQCQVPVLVVRGMDDPNDQSTVREVAELLPQSSYVELPGVGHTPWLERPELLREQLEEFLGTLGLAGLYRAGYRLPVEAGASAGCEANRRWSESW